MRTNYTIRKLAEQTIAWACVAQALAWSKGIILKIENQKAAHAMAIQPN